MQESDASCTVECDFDASGRWFYETNIENLGYWCEQDQLLTALSWKLKFDFNDAEKYEDHRLECLEEAVSSYITLADSSATQEKAEKKITQLFDPLFNPVDGELA